MGDMKAGGATTTTRQYADPAKLPALARNNAPAQQQQVDAKIQGGRKPWEQPLDGAAMPNQNVSKFDGAQQTAATQAVGAISPAQQQRSTVAKSFSLASGFSDVLNGYGMGMAVNDPKSVLPSLKGAIETTEKVGGAMMKAAGPNFNSAFGAEHEATLANMNKRWGEIRPAFDAAVEKGDTEKAMSLFGEMKQMNKQFLDIAGPEASKVLGSGASRANAISEGMRTSHSASRLLDGYAVTLERPDLTPDQKKTVMGELDNELNKLERDGATLYPNNSLSEMIGKEKVDGLTEKWKQLRGDLSGAAESGDAARAAGALRQATSDQGVFSEFRKSIGGQYATEAAKLSPAEAARTNLWNSMDLAGSFRQVAEGYGSQLARTDLSPQYQQSLLTNLQGAIDRMTKQGAEIGLENPQSLAGAFTPKQLGELGQIYGSWGGLKKSFDDIVARAPSDPSAMKSASGVVNKMLELNAQYLKLAGDRYGELTSPR